MAKRSRGSRRDRRRGGRHAPSAPAAPRPAAESRAAVPFVPSSTPAAAAPLPGSAPRSPTLGARPPSILSAKAAEEYRYVGPDLRRIAVVVGTLLAAMLALWVAIDVLRVVSV